MWRVLGGVPGCSGGQADGPRTSENASKDGKTLCHTASVSTPRAAADAFLTARVPAELAADVKRVALASDRSMSWVVRLALREHLRTTDEASPPVAGSQEGRGNGHASRP